MPLAGRSAPDTADQVRTLGAALGGRVADVDANADRQPPRGPGMIRQYAAQRRHRVNETPRARGS